MKKILIISGLAALTAFASVASANMVTRSPHIKSVEGGLVGNGGGTVVCRTADHQIKSVELLDYYEVKQHPGLLLELESMNGDWKERVKQLFARVQTQSEFRFELYSRWFKTFEQDMLLLDDVEMSTVADAGYVVLPRGCGFEQAVIQRTPIFSGDPRYFVNAELWNKMDDVQKAGLVMHELIYREALAYRHTDSIRTRYLNGMYASKNIKSMKFKDYTAVLEQAHFEIIDVKMKFGKLAPEFRVSLKRLSQPGPDDGEDPRDPEVLSYVTNVPLIQLGTCLDEGCKTYESYRNFSTVLNGKEDRNFGLGIRLASDVISMKVKDTVFSNFKEFIEISPFFNVGDGEGDGFYLSLIPRNRTGGFEPITVYFENKFSSKFYYGSFGLSKDGNSLIIGSLQAWSLFKVVEDQSFENPLINMNVDCALAEIDMHSELLRAIIYKTYCAQGVVPSFSVTSRFALGYATKYYEMGQYVYYNHAKLFDESLSIPSGLSGWKPNSRAGSSWDILSCNREGAPKAGNCMNSVLENGQITKLTIVNEAFYNYYFKYLKVKAGQTIELGPRGYLKSFIADDSLQMNTGGSNVDTIIHPGDTVMFDDDGQFIGVTH